MCQCFNHGHVFCQSEIIPQTIEVLKKWLEENKNYFTEKNYNHFMSINDKDEFIEEMQNNLDEIPNCSCPICTLSHIKNNDLLSYIVKKYNIDIEKEKQEIKNKFKNFEEFQKYLL